MSSLEGEVNNAVDFADFMFLLWSPKFQTLKAIYSLQTHCHLFLYY